MNKQPSALALTLAGLGFFVIAGTPVLAGENEGTETLYQDNCVKCHGSEVYTREDRKITSLDGLERQVQRCELSLGLQWFDEDIQNVTTHLNQNFYHFPK